MIMIERGENSQTDMFILLDKTKGCDYKCAPLQCIFIVFFEMLTPPMYFNRFLHTLQPLSIIINVFIDQQKLVIMLERGCFFMETDHKNNDYV